MYENSRENKKKTAARSPIVNNPSRIEQIVKQEDIESSINHVTRRDMTDLDMAVNNMSQKMNDNHKLVNRKINNHNKENINQSINQNQEVKCDNMTFKDKIKQENDINKKTKMGDNKRTPSPNSNISNSTINDKITESPDRHCYNGINNKNRLNVLEKEKLIKGNNRERITTRSKVTINKRSNNEMEDDVSPVNKPTHDKSKQNSLVNSKHITNKGDNNANYTKSTPNPIKIDLNKPKVDPKTTPLATNKKDRIKPKPTPKAPTDDESFGNEDSEDDFD